jgi:hypothetical protein
LRLRVVVVPPTVSPLVAMIAAASAVEVINGRPRAALTVRMVPKGCVRFIRNVCNLTIE